MIDDLDEYEDVKKLIAKYEESIKEFKRNKEQKPRLDLMKKEVESLKAELKDFDRKQKMSN
jgi:predicted RNase H-like nuclease (RuvC/YqgF family)